MSIKKSIITNSSWVLFSRVFGALVGLAFYALLTRLLSAEEVGTYFLALSTATALAAIAGLGLPRTSTRLLAESTHDKNSFSTKNIVTQSIMLTFMAGILLILTYTYFISNWLAVSVFDNSLFTSLTVFIAIWIVLFALRQLIAESFRGLGNIKLASLFSGVVSNSIATAILAVTYYLLVDITITQAVLYMLIGLTISFLVAIVLLFKELPATKTKTAISTATILGISLPIMITEIVQVILAQSNIWILGSVSNEAEVAIYGVIMQIVLLVSFPFMIINNAIPQLVVKFNAADQKDKLERLMQTVSTIAFIPALLLVMFMILFGESLLTLIYGNMYGAGISALIWLSVGQLINVISGPCGIALILTGHQNITMVVTTITGFIAIPLAIYLSGIYGATGAAASAAIAMAAQNITLAVLVKRKMGVRTYTSFSKKTLLLIMSGTKK
jgi:O-antigen/teichoic acid export membrane protein